MMRGSGVVGGATLVSSNAGRAARTSECIGVYMDEDTGLFVAEIHNQRTRTTDVLGDDFPTKFAADLAYNTRAAEFAGPLNAESGTTKPAVHFASGVGCEGCGKHFDTAHGLVMHKRLTQCGCAKGAGRASPKDPSPSSGSASGAHHSASGSAKPNISASSKPSISTKASTKTSTKTKASTSSKATTSTEASAEASTEASASPSPSTDASTRRASSHRRSREKTWKGGPIHSGIGKPLAIVFAAGEEVTVVGWQTYGTYMVKRIFVKAGEQVAVLRHATDPSADEAEVSVTLLEKAAVDGGSDRARQETAHAKASSSSGSSSSSTTTTITSSSDTSSTTGKSTSINRTSLRTAARTVASSATCVGASASVGIDAAAATHPIQLSPVAPVAARPARIAPSAASTSQARVRGSTPGDNEMWRHKNRKSPFLNVYWSKTSANWKYEVSVGRDRPRITGQGFQDEEECARARDTVAREQNYPTDKLNFPSPSDGPSDGAPNGAAPNGSPNGSINSSVNGSISDLAAGTHLVGRKVRKAFEGLYYDGTVTSAEVGGSDGALLYQIMYADGDQEDMEEEELVSVIVPSPGSPNGPTGPVNGTNGTNGSTPMVAVANGSAYGPHAPSISPRVSNQPEDAKGEGSDKGKGKNKGKGKGKGKARGDGKGMSKGKAKGKAKGKDNGKGKDRSKSNATGEEWQQGVEFEEGWAAMSSDTDGQRGAAEEDEMDEGEMGEYKHNYDYEDLGRKRTRSNSELTGRIFEEEGKGLI